MGTSLFARGSALTPPGPRKPLDPAKVLYETRVQGSDIVVPSIPRSVRQRPDLGRELGRRHLPVPRSLSPRHEGHFDLAGATSSLLA